MIPSLFRRRKAPLLAVSVQAPCPDDEWEVSWYRERLHDDELLAEAIVVVVGWIRYLAVPVGGQRRGGYISVTDPVWARRLAEALLGREGFPDVRVQWSEHPSVLHVVEWGDVAPDSVDDAVRGHFYGYSTEAVARFQHGREAVST